MPEVPRTRDGPDRCGTLPAPRPLTAIAAAGRRHPAQDCRREAAIRCRHPPPRLRPAHFERMTGGRAGFRWKQSSLRRCPRPRAHRHTLRATTFALPPRSEHRQPGPGQGVRKAARIDVEVSAAAAELKRARRVGRPVVAVTALGLRKHRTRQRKARETADVSRHGVRHRSRELACQHRRCAARACR